MEQQSIKITVVALVAVVVGGIGGFYFGSGDAYKRGVVAGIAEEKAVIEARAKEAEKEAARAVNPFEQTSTNPFDKAPVNPYDNVKVNPFE